MRICLFVLACALCLPVPARAQINLAWNDCITQPSAAANVAYACDGSRNGQPFRLVPSFVSPIQLTQFVGIQATIDVHTEAINLPDWWRLAGPPNSPGPPECRTGNIVFPASTEGIGTGTTGACRNPWLGATEIGGGWAWYSESRGDGSPTPWTGWGRLKIAIARRDSAVLSANTQYIVGVIEIDTQRDVDTGEGTCTGCGLSACIVLNEVALYQIVGTPPEDVVYLTAALNREFVTWNDKPGMFLCYVPTRRATWGSIKATYR